MTLLDLLAADLLGRLEDCADGVERRVLLWLDPEGQFSRLVGHLEPALVARGAQLLRYDPGGGCGQVALKLALLRLDGTPGERAVVYLPGFDRGALAPGANGAPPRLWSVYEHRFKGRLWGLGGTRGGDELPTPPTLLGWLRRHGVATADARATRELTAGGPDSLLARYAERRRGDPPEGWPRPLRTSDVLAGLAGDPRDALRGVLAAPKNEVTRWGAEQAIVLRRIGDEYGLGPAAVRSGDDTSRRPSAREAATAFTARVPPPDAEELADALAAQLALTEAWDAFGRGDDFPFLSRLPTTEEQRRRTVRLVREDVLSHTALGPSFLRRVARLEPGFDLAGWAANRTGEPAALPLLARKRWRRFLQRFDDAADRSWKESRELALAERDAIRAGAGAARDRPNGETCWFVLADVVHLIERARQALDQAAALGEAAGLVRAYADGWWQIDRLHLRVRAACARVAGLERVRRVADRAYFEYATDVNQRFSEHVEVEGRWPPSACRGVEGVRKALWSDGAGRRAVIISDACRWDLAQGLRERLPHDAELSAVLATLPTTTPFGMTAMLPLHDGPVAVGLSAHDLTIKQGGGPDLATRDGRKAFFQATLVGGNGAPRVGFLDMDELLLGVTVPGTPLVIVFDNTIDEQGHKGTEELPGLVEPFVGNLKRTIDRLHEVGIGEVHLVTDHGFLLVPPEAVDELGRPEVLPAQAVHKAERWAALEPDAPVAELIRMPLPLASEIRLGFPRGLRTLIKASGFVHGGISLQECVIPHLVSRISPAQARVGVDLRVSTDQLTVGTVPAILRPAIGEVQPPLGGMQPVRVRVWVETAPEAGSAARRVTDPIEQELRPDVEELRPPVYLKEGLGLRAGQRLVLRAEDAESGRDLGSRPLTLLVDWE